jgi:predicted O-linked N-acetylglucosamine transferase (SPINDLY family)
MDSDRFDQHFQQGEERLAKGRPAEAMSFFERCVELRPADPQAHLALGSALTESGRDREALGPLKRAVELDATLVRGLIRLGNVLRALSRTGEAVESYGRALELRPADPFILSNLGNAWLDLGESVRAIDCYLQSLAIFPDAPVTHSNLVFALQYDSGVGREEIAAAHREWGERFGAEPVAVPARPERVGGRPLRVGFLSADFRYHPVGRMASVVWQHLGRQRVTPIVYDNSRVETPAKQRYRTQVDTWHNIAGKSDAQVVALIRSDELDLLLDFSGHTSGNRLSVLTQKPAPVQATIFGYPNTTGLSAVDYRITDTLADPPGAEFLYVERLVRLPRTAWVYGPPEVSPEPGPLPCLGGQPFTFGCLNNPAKISDAAVESWSEILRICPDARLLLLVRNDPVHEGLLLGKFSRYRVNEKRLIFAAKGPEAAYLELHNRIDLMLDPFPYNGGVTTGDCLWMGTPILALEGDSYVSRQGVALLKGMGMEEFIATDREELVAKAAAWAANPEKLADRSAGLRERFQASPLMDHAGYALELETAFREIVTA